MYKIFTLAAAIAILPLSNKNADPLFIGTANHSFNARIISLKNSVPFLFQPGREQQAASSWSAGWLNDVQEQIRKSEYNFTQQGKCGVYSTPNRKNNLRFFYNEKGFTAEPLTVKIPVGEYDQSKRPDEIKYKTIPNWKIDFILDKKQISNGIWKATGNKAEYAAKNITVQYLNDDEGMRQDFLVRSALSKTKQLEINFSIKTKLKTYLRGNQLQFFHHRSGHVLNYDGLKVWDANGKDLQARIKKVKRNKYCISVNTSGAAYPIRVDPLSSTPNTTLNGGAPGELFGNSVASAGDVNGDGYSDVIIGAVNYNGINLNEGRVFVYHGGAGGLSATPNDIFSYCTEAYAHFGRSVASAGDVNGDGYSDVIIGAEQFDDDFINEGVAFIHYGSAGGLSASPVKLDDADQDDAYFGYSVAGAGDINGDGYSDVIIGAFSFDASFTDQGAAFIYYGTAGGISANPGTILIDADQGSSYYALAVSAAGDVNGDGFSDVLVGAYLYDDNGNINEGRAYLYYGAPVIATYDILDDADQPDSFLGHSLACAGDVNGDGYSDVIIGADGFNDAGSAFEGRAFIYYGSGSGLSASPNRLLVDANQAGANFGNSVACAGDINGDGYSDVVVGAYGFDGAVTNNEGQAYVYFGSSTGLSATPVNILSDANQADANFGNSVACAGDINGDGYSDVIIGSYRYDGTFSDAGRAFIYHGSPDGLKTSSNWQTESNQGGAYYGINVASAGDVNSDGYSDVLVGAYTFTTGSSQDGKAFLYLGSATGLPASPAWTATGTMTAEYFGSAVAAAGDVNGDGYADVLVGAYGYTFGQSQEGRAYLFYGSPGGLSASPAWTKESDIATGILGATLATAGDVNGDGYSDVAIGAFQASNPQSNEGKVYVFYGSAAGLAATEDWTKEGEQANAYFGSAVSTAGDVNGDGFADLLIGSYQYSNPEAFEGKVFVYYGSSTGLLLTPGWTAESNQPNAFFGKAAGCAADVNGDGYSDIIVGAYQYSNPETFEGKVFVYYGSSTGPSLTANWTAESNLPNVFFGYAVSSAGDVNGDGYSDVLIGARDYSNGEANEGALYAYYGSPSGLPATANWFIESNLNNILLGHSVAAAGDVNGDGYSDVIAGAPFFANPQSNEGGAFVYHGNSPGTALRNNIRLYNTDLATPINSSNFVIGNFGAGLFAKSYLGSQKGKLVWETRLNYNAYSGTPITNSTAFSAEQAMYTDLGTTGTELKAVITKILGSTKYTKMRARVKYDPVTAITGQVYGPWRNISAVIDGNHLGALPLELLSFKVAWIEKGRSAQLNFTTQKETGICCFEIAKSLDGFNFNAIGSVAAKNMSGTQSYTFTDHAATSKEQFYRLKITGSNGKVEYSNILQLQNHNVAEIVVFPNPATEIIQLQLNKTYSKINVQIINSAGQIIKQVNNLSSNNQSIKIIVSDLPAGNYWLRLQSGKDKQQLQFIKQ